MSVGLHSALHSYSPTLAAAVDSLRVFLCLQVAGYKLIRLFLESDTPYMYRTTASKSTTRHSQGNFSAVDVEHADLDRFPEFVSLATAYEAVVGPGDFRVHPGKMLALRPRAHAVDKHQLLVLDIEHQCIDWPLNRTDSSHWPPCALFARASPRSEI